jgi:hypothetical protein
VEKLTSFFLIESNSKFEIEKVLFSPIDVMLNMYCYILDLSINDWIESESLYPTDVALLIDNEKRILYLYNGPRSSIKNQQLGEKLASKLHEKYEIYKFEPLSDVIPMHLQIEIDLLMGEHKNENREKEPRTLLLKVYSVIVGFIGVIAFILLIEQFLMLRWNHPENGYYVTALDFTKFFSLGEIFVWILIGASLSLLLIAILSQKLYLIGSSLIASAINFSLWLYIRKREFLFSFNPTTPYLVNRFELLTYLFWITTSLFVILSILGYSVLSILKETKSIKKEKIGIEEMRLKSKPSILKDKEPVVMEEIED